ncbi:hypothetical protein QBC33DRAFT_198344 [Phialemonium atrogriseum]|uniref:Uncharacterized protein n=1 Tax=Phialemonium atrogriseum TaxID=1093897 RepID=A0AAJ0BU97_9PEZI|nr:uncharacterized protein QBC33DRAFT_198344 [Phialemonium atrogriseum]KAK1764410.1 hypothetical protein QBC33DRAFT_198344 [Phialemonium atrogriseum]
MRVIARHPLHVTPPGRLAWGDRLNDERPALVLPSASFLFPLGTWYTCASFLEAWVDGGGQPCVGRDVTDRAQSAGVRNLAAVVGGRRRRWFLPFCGAGSGLWGTANWRQRKSWIQSLAQGRWLERCISYPGLISQLLLVYRCLSPSSTFLPLLCTNAATSCGLCRGLSQPQNAMDFPGEKTPRSGCLLLQSTRHGGDQDLSLRLGICTIRNEESAHRFQALTEGASACLWGPSTALSLVCPVPPIPLCSRKPRRIQRKGVWPRTVHINSALPRRPHHPAQCIGCEPRHPSAVPPSRPARQPSIPLIAAACIWECMRTCACAFA